MDKDKKTAERKKRITPKAPVQMVVKHEFVGTQTVIDAFIPIIYEDIRRTVTEVDTLDTGSLSA